VPQEVTGLLVSVFYWLIEVRTQLPPHIPLTFSDDVVFLKLVSSGKAFFGSILVLLPFGAFVSKEFVRW
jgi:hypothetical protein